MVVCFSEDRRPHFEFAEKTTTRIAPLGTYTKNPKLTHAEAKASAVEELKQAEAQLKAAKAKLTIVEEAAAAAEAVGPPPAVTSTTAARAGGGAQTAWNK